MRRGNFTFAILTTKFSFGLDQSEGIGAAHFTLPPGDTAIGFTTVLLELEQAQHEIAQGGHDLGASPSADAGGIFFHPGGCLAGNGSLFRPPPSVPG